MPASHLELVTLAARAKAYLKATHRTYRSAAVELDVSYQHLSDVLNGRRQSRRLVNRILALPKHRPVDLSKLPGKPAI